LPDFRKARVLVIGDVMLDQYITGNTSRISPEAPVPVVHVNGTHYQAGGAGNVALNLAELGCATTLVGLVGKDRQAATLKKILDESKVDGILFESDFPTITKIRVISRAQQLIRLDYEEPFELLPKEESKLVQAVEKIIPYHHVIILSDYAKGCLSENVCRKIIAAGQNAGIPVVTDPKNRNWERYAGSYVITPNFREFCEAAGKDIPNTSEAIDKEGKKWIGRSGAGYILITRSEKGMSLVTPGKVFHWDALAREVYDVSGAGDTVVAALSGALACGMPIEEAAQLANAAAGIVVGKSGTATVSTTELSEIKMV